MDEKMKECFGNVPEECEECESCDDYGPCIIESFDSIENAEKVMVINIKALKRTLRN